MDKRNAVKNVTVSIISKIAITVMAILARKILITNIDSVILGLDSLYSSIIGVLSVSELGIGTAITFCMYKPIVEGDKAKISALYNLLKKIYIVIGIIILLAGFCVTPFLPTLAKDYTGNASRLYITFLILLSSTVLSYFFGCKVSLINAYKNNYITSALSSLIYIVRYCLQMVVVIVTKSFVCYMLCFLITTIVHWILIDLVYRKDYQNIIIKSSRVDSETKKEVVDNVKAMVFHKVGEVLINSTDNIIISSFVGVAILAKYSNYVAVMSALTGIIGMFFTPLVSVIGHSFYENKRESYGYYCFFHKFNFLLGFVFFLGYNSVVSELIQVIFGEQLILDDSICFVITVNGFIQFMRRATLLYREATGTFYYDKWKPFVEGICNVILSVWFATILKGEYRIIGILVATIITNLFICHIVEPYMLHKHRFNISFKKYLIRNYLYVIVFSLTVLIFNSIKIKTNSIYIDILANGTIACLIGLLAFVGYLIFDKAFRQICMSFVPQFKKKKNIH